MLLWIWECIYLFELMFSFPLDTFPEVELLDHMIVQFLIFWGSSILFSIWLYQFMIPPTVHKGSLITSLPAFVICCLFVDGHFKRYEVIPHCSYDLHFPNGLMMLSTYSCYLVAFCMCSSETCRGQFYENFLWVVP